jgi:sugar lactone lactonase YvrE
VFVPDAADSRILRISKSGKITHFAGEPGFFRSEGDGCPAIYAHLDVPLGLAVDSADNLYITDHFSGRIRKVDQEGIITTVAGSDDCCFVGDGGPATKAYLQEPVAVAVDDAGRIYIADRDNFRVRAVDTDGTITTLAGNGSTGPDRIDGPATEAALGLPVGVAAGPEGVVYISDEPAHRVYKVGADGIMTTFAGTGNAGYSGDDGPATDAELNGPQGLTTDARGNVYIADAENHAIRVVDRKGTIRTVAGSGTAGFGGDGKSATRAQLNLPNAVAVDDSGAIYIADSDNDRVRRVDPAGKISTILP